MIAWYLVRRATLMARVLSVLSFMPLAIPNVIIALAILLLYTATPLHGTLLILILAFMTRYLAFTTRVMHAAQLQIDKVLEEAALVAGAGRLSTFVKINLRVLLPALLNGWLWVVAHVVRDFAVPLFLATSSTLMVPLRITHPRKLAGEHRVIIVLGMLGPATPPTLDADADPIGQASAARTCMAASGHRHGIICLRWGQATRRSRRQEVSTASDSSLCWVGLARGGHVTGTGRANASRRSGVICQGRNALRSVGL